MSRTPTVQATTPDPERPRLGLGRAAGYAYRSAMPGATRLALRAGMAAAGRAAVSIAHGDEASPSERGREPPMSTGARGSHT